MDDIWEELLEEIDEHGTNLTEWEIDFIEDMVVCSEMPDWEPTPSQKRTIERIHRNRV